MTKTYNLIFLEPGHKVLISNRRLFEKDKMRFFIGTVDGFNENNGLLKITGYSFSQPSGATQFKKKSKSSTRIMSLTSGNMMVYVLPEKINIDEANINFKSDASVVLEDSSSEFLDLTE